MSAWDSPIVRISTGRLNTVDDELIGGVSGGTGQFSKFAGQLGKTLWVSPDQISSMYSSAVGTLYGGRYRYVRQRSTDDAFTAVGQICFWDNTITDWQKYYQVTREEDLSSSDNAIFIAGVILSIPTPGNYFWIQDLGMVNVHFASAFTSAGAIGSRCYAAGLGDGANEGYADVINTADPATFGDVTLMQARYLGNAVTAPVVSVASPVLLGFHNILG